MPNPQRLLKILAKSLIENKDSITAFATGGSMLSTVIFAIAGQRKADKEIEEENKHLAVNDEEPLTAREEVAISVKHHVMTIIGTGATIFFIVKLHKTGQEYKAQVIELTGAYGLLSKSYDDLQRAIDETGHRDEIKEKVLDNVYQDNKEEIKKVESEHPHDGLSCFIEETTKQKFWSTREDVKAAINKINWEMNASSGYAEISINELLNEFGLSHMGGGLGDRIGWDANYTGLVDPKFYRPDPGDDNPGENVWVVGYFNPPKENFGRELL